MDEGFAEDFDIVVEIPEPRLVGTERSLGGVAYLVNERPDHIDQGVIAVEYGLDAVVPGVGYLDAAFFYLGDDLLHDLYSHRALSVGAAVFVGRFPAGG